MSRQLSSSLATPVLTLFCLALASVAHAQTTNPGNNSLKPQLGSLGKSLLSESFDAKELPKPWTRNTGTLVIHDGVLEVCEQSSDHHAAAFRYPLPLKDCAIQIDFKMAAHSKMVHLGFDPAPGELKKKGHLFSVAVTPTSWSIIEHGDKNDEKPKNKVLANEKVSFAPGQWFTLLLECKGNEVVAQIAGKGVLKGSSPDFHVKKPGLVFRMSGPDGEPVAFDNVKVWEL